MSISPVHSLQYTKWNNMETLDSTGVTYPNNIIALTLSGKETNSDNNESQSCTLSILIKFCDLRFLISILALDLFHH